MDLKPDGMNDLNSHPLLACYPMNTQTTMVQIVLLKTATASLRVLGSQKVS